MNTHLAGRRKVGEEESGRERDTNANFLCCPLRRGGMRGKKGGEESKRMEEWGRAKEREKGRISEKGRKQRSR